MLDIALAKYEKTLKLKPIKRSIKNVFLDTYFG